MFESKRFAPASFALSTIFSVCRMRTKENNKYLLAVAALLFILTLGACGGGGGGGSAPPPVSSVPKILSVTPSQNSAIATGILGSFQIDFQFRDLGGDLDGGIFCMDWGGQIISIPLDSSFAGIQSGTCSILFSLFQMSSVVGNITVQCWLTDKAGNESGRTSFLFSQTAPHWPWQWGTTGNDSGVGIVIDSQDHILVIGNAAVPAGQQGALIAEYLPDAFCNGLLPLDVQTGKAVATDAANNIYATGGTNVYTDISLSKYDPHGNQIWASTLSASADNNVAGIAVDKDGNVYVTGGTAGGVDGNVNAGGLGWDMYITKYDAAGNKQWTRQLGTQANEYGSGIAFDSLNNVYIVGGTGGPLDGQPHVGNSDVTFLVKYDSSGNKIWTKLFGSVLNYSGAGIVIDSTDNIYVAGSTFDNNLNGLAAVGFVTKFNTAGELQWMQELGGQSWYAECFAIALDHNNNIVVTGAAYGSVTSDTPTDSIDAFVAKYDSAGNRIWFTLVSTPGNDYGYAIAVDSNNYIYLTGTTDGSFPGYSNAGYNDIFIAKLDSNGVLQP